MCRTARVIDRSVLRELALPEHGGEASKADRGKLLIVAGSVRLPGAAILAARAALRVGCGTVRLAAPRSVALAIGVALPELMVLPMPETPDGSPSKAALSILEGQAGACDASVVGPGLESGEAADFLVERYLADSPLPTVIDAGALLAWGRAGHRPGPGHRILTPHLGEFGRLTGLEPDTVERDREGLASRFAREWASILVLKGRRTIVAGDHLYLNDAGSPGLATAGSGDVLAGVIGGLLARGSEPIAAAAWGVHLHAIAGEIAADRRGVDSMIASDLVDCLPDALRLLR